MSTDAKVSIASLDNIDKALRFCASCGEKKFENSIRKCSRCRKIGYCNETCQKNHWKAHKAVCNVATLADALVPKIGTHDQQVVYRGNIATAKMIAQSLCALQPHPQYLIISLLSEDTSVLHVHYRGPIHTLEKLTIMKFAEWITTGLLELCIQKDPTVVKEIEEKCLAAEMLKSKNPDVEVKIITNEQALETAKVTSTGIFDPELTKAWTGRPNRVLVSCDFNNTKLGAYFIRMNLSEKQ